LLDFAGGDLELFGRIFLEGAVGLELLLFVGEGFTLVSLLINSFFVDADFMRSTFQLASQDISFHFATK